MKSDVRLARSQEVGGKVATMLGKRLQVANDKFAGRVKKAVAQAGTGGPAPFAQAADPLAWANYVVDAAQRSVLFLDTLRRRGDDFLENTAAGLKPVLNFEYETVLDARGFDKPVNYALLRILPPAGVKIDARKRPYIV